MNGRALVAVASVLVLGAGGCSTSDGSTTPSEPTTTSTVATTFELTTTTRGAWTDQDVTFVVGADELHGILTVPAAQGPHRAVVLAAPSVGPTGGQPSGVSDHPDLAHRFAEAGIAAFRYDPPGVGQSGGEAGLQTFAMQADQVLAALRRLQELPAVRADRVGLWGISQQAWVISMVAADHPDEVAFLIAVSGSGVSAAEQQVYGIETQSRADGLQPDDVERASLIGRLLIDWQLSDPLYHDVNQQAADQLGPGPWHELLPLVYEPAPLGPADNLNRVIAILTSIRDEPWAAALYLDTVWLPALSNIPPDQIEAVRATAEQSLQADPRDQLTRVTCPVVAFFGEDDIVQPTDRSAALYARYLEQAHNDDVTIVILPDVGHDIVLSTPGYWDQLTRWVDHL